MAHPCEKITRSPMTMGMASIMVVAVAASAAIAQAQQVWPSTSQRTDFEKRILAELEKPTTFDFSETPLVEAVDYINGLHSINALIDANGLTEMGLNSSNELITASFRGMSLRSALTNTLAPLGCDFGVRNDVLIIAPRGAESLLEIRSYNVKRILEKGLDPNQVMELVRFHGGAEAGAKVDAKMLGSVLVLRETVCGHHQMSCLLATVEQSLDAGDRPLLDLGKIPTVADSSSEREPAPRK